jgi:hypothetical protein
LNGSENRVKPIWLEPAPHRSIRAISTIRLALLPAPISNSMRRAGAISDRGWSREFDDPIVLPEGEKLRTLRDAATDVTGLPKKEAALPEWQAAIEALMLVAERGGPTMFARIGMESSKPTRRARVRYVTEGKALGQAQTRARSMKQEAVEVAAWVVGAIGATGDVPFARMHTRYILGST